MVFVMSVTMSMVMQSGFFRTINLREDMHRRNVEEGAYRSEESHSNCIVEKNHRAGTRVNIPSSVHKNDVG